MKIAPLVLLVLTAASGIPAQPPSPPDLPDLTIRTKTTSAGRVLGTAMLRVKGARQRLDGPHSIVHITQCDTRRSLMLNEPKRIYAAVPFFQDRQKTNDGARPPPDTRPIGQTIVIDAVDTGERRAFGPLTARRVVTTTTTEHAGDAGPATTRVQDGWYLELPGEACGQTTGIVLGFLTAGPYGARTEIRWKGTARTGWPVIETDRTIAGRQTFVVSTTVEAMSEARLDPALFEAPAGYRAALPLGYGRFDLERPDTLVNRVRAACESAASWIHYKWSSLTSSPPSQTVAGRRQ